MIMAHYSSNRGTRNRTNINVKNDLDVHYWASELGVDQKALTAAVRKVGPSIRKVREHLKMGGGLNERDDVVR